MTVSEVWGETGWKSFSGGRVRRQKSRHGIRFRSCLRAILHRTTRRGFRRLHNCRRLARWALAGQNKTLRSEARLDKTRNHRLAR